LFLSKTKLIVKLKWQRLRKNTLPYKGLQSIASHKINVPMHEPFKFFLKREKGKELDRLVEFNEQIDIAFGCCLASNHRAEEREPRARSR
jgi:hypothetical protein